MRIVVSDPAVDLIAERGGRLYVWLKRDRCCGGITRLVTASEPPSEKEFRRVGAYGKAERGWLDLHSIEQLVPIGARGINFST